MNSVKIVCTKRCPNFHLFLFFMYNFLLPLPILHTKLSSRENFLRGSQYRFQIKKTLKFEILKMWSKSPFSYRLGHPPTKGNPRKGVPTMSINIVHSFTANITTLKWPNLKSKTCFEKFSLRESFLGGSQYRFQIKKCLKFEI